jgi:hypothetical protein
MLYECKARPPNYTPIDEVIWECKDCGFEEPHDEYLVRVKERMEFY